MGWTASYQLLRDRPLDDDELGALADFCAHHNRPPWEGERFGLAVTREARADRVIADGWQKLPMSQDSHDLERLCRVLNALADLLTGVEVRIADDFGAFGWDAAAGKVTTHDAAGPAPIHLPYEVVQASFAAPDALIPPRFRPLPAGLAAWLATGERGSREQLGWALIELVDIPDEHPARAELLARIRAARPRRLALAGLTVYGQIARSSAAWDLVSAALALVEEPSDVAAEFLAVWRHPHGLYWYGDMSFPDRLVDGLARTPAVQQQWLDDVAAALAGAGEELAHRRAERAAQWLGRARSTAALIALIGGARATRGHPLSSDLKYRTVPGLYEGLTLAAVPAVVPTLLIDLGAGEWHRHQGRAVLALVTLAGARVGPVLIALADAGAHLYEVIPALKQLGDDTARAALARVAAGPFERSRAWAVTALRDLGVEPPAPTPLPVPAALLTHPWREAREHALSELDRSGELAQLRTLLIGIAIDRAIRRRDDDRTMIGRRLPEVLPGDLQRAAIDEQLAWLDGEGGGLVPVQARWPEAEAALAEGADAIAERMPRLWPRLDAATEAALIAEEGAVLVALQAGALAANGAIDAVAPAPVAITLVPADQPAPPPIATVAAVTARTDDEAGAGDRDELIDELIDVMAREQPLSAALIARAGLADSITVLDGWDRARAIRTRLAAIDAARAGMRLLALLPSIHHLPHLGPLAELVLPAAVSSPSAGAAVARLWDDAFGRPWESPSRVTELVMPVIATPALLAAVLDEVAAPDEGTMRERTRSALELLGSASAERDVAAAALIARLHADRTRADDQVGWREATCRALRKLADHRTLPTAILELAASGGTARRRDDLLALLADLGGAQARTALAHLIDLPDLAVATVKAVGRSSLASPERHARFIGHPFWKIRLAAADSNRNYTEGKLETYAVWAAIEAAGLAVPVDDRRWARSDRDPPGATWDELAAAHGTPITLTPLPPARAGADSSCADYRAWSLWALDERADPADAVVRVVADELDRALCGRGHARHGGRWSRWRERLPELPTDRAGRLAWARARGDDALSSTMAGVLDGGADDVAATLPGSMLTLSAAERADLEGLEAPLVERGRTLFRDGVLPRAL